MSATTSTSSVGAEPSLLRRLAHTPMRDIVRGRISGRLDLKRQVAAADLPLRLESIVLQVARRSRLWRMEKADVADELIAHFADGLKVGVSPEALAGTFGCTPRAAKLIRRAKRRNRPLVWKAWIRTVQGVGLLMGLVGLLIGLIVVIYIVAAIRLYTGKPVVAHDYLADVNAAARAVPEAQRAWPMYRSALVALGQIPEEINLRARPGDSDWDEVAEFVATHAEALTLVRQAAARPGLGYISGYVIDDADLVLWPERASDSNDRRVEFGLMGEGLNSHFAELRKLSRLLALDAYRAAAMGDGSLVAANIEASLGIAEHARETSRIINWQVSLWQIMLVLGTVGEILAEHSVIFSESQLQALAHRLSVIHGGRIQLRLDGERWACQDFLQRLYTDDGEGDGRLTATGLSLLLDGAGTLTSQDALRSSLGPLAPALGLANAGRREMTEEFSRLFTLAEAEFAKPLWEQDTAKADREIGHLKRSRMATARKLPVALLMPALGKVGVWPQLVTQERDAMLVAIALELYRRNTGSWPQSLDMLVPDLLPVVPPDRFDGRPMRYRLVDGRPRLYSIGADRDDDGGRPPIADRDRFNRTLAAMVRNDPAKAVDGDWVLWPPVPKTPDESVELSGQS